LIDLSKRTRNATAKTFVSDVFLQDIHAKQVESLSNGTIGVMASTSLAVSVIGASLAQAKELWPKHAIKQVDRLLSNEKIVPWVLFERWVPEVVGTRTSIVVAMDWTDFDADNQATLALHLVTSHGRAMPLLWLTVDKDELKDQRNDFEDLCLARLKEILPPGLDVTIVADRGFGDVKLFEFIEQLNFSYCIRFRGNVQVSSSEGEKRLAADWVGRAGRARKLTGASITAAGFKAGAVVCVHARDMKESWCLATSHADRTAAEITNLYSRRWTIEPSFRDTKDLRFGMGLSSVRIRDPQRRDRLLLLNAMAIMLLTLLGTAGEAIGYDKYLKVNTSKKRTHSLFRQGAMLYDLIATFSEARLRPLIEAYEEILKQNNVLNDMLAASQK